MEHLSFRVFGEGHILNQETPGSGCMILGVVIRSFYFTTKKSHHLALHLLPCAFLWWPPTICCPKMNPSIKYGGDTCNTEWLANYLLANRVLLMDKILQLLGCMKLNKKPWHTYINSSSENPLVSNRISICTDMIAMLACFKSNSTFERESSVPSTDC